VQLTIGVLACTAHKVRSLHEKRIASGNVELVDVTSFEGSQVSTKMSSRKRVLDSAGTLNPGDRIAPGPATWLRPMVD
jgi:hypothetical protein